MLHLKDIHCQQYLKKYFFKEKTNTNDLGKQTHYFMLVRRDNYVSFLLNFSLKRFQLLK